MRKRKQTKGIAYISKVLREKRPQIFKTKKSANEKAREIKKILKQSGKSILIKNILPLAKDSKTRKKKDEAPKLHPSFLEIENYFVLADYPARILTRATKNIWFRSKVSPAGLPLIQGGTLPDYTEYFADFVNYVNSMAGMEEDSTRYEVDWFITTKSPVKEQDKWVAEIISCTIDGNEFVYGFNEKKPDEAPKKVVTTDVGVKKEEKPTEKPTEDIARIDREIELSKQRERESKQRQQEVETKFQRIKELKEMGFTNQEILDLLK